MKKLPDFSPRDTIRIVHIANLDVTLKRFVIPLAASSNDLQVEHLFAHSTSRDGAAVSAIPLTLSRGKLGIIKAWIQSKDNAQSIALQNPDIVHIHTPATALSLFFSLRKLKKGGVKVVYTSRGSLDEGGNVVRKVLWRFIDPLRWTIWDGVCVINDHLLMIAGKTIQRPMKKVSMGAAAPNWEPNIELLKRVSSSEDSEPLRLAWVGRISKDKRLEDFIDLVTTLDESRQRGCIGEIIGASLDGDGRATYRSEAANLFFHGWLKSPMEVLSRCDALVSTSTREGYGLVPLEAALVGTPTIAIANHGTRESVPTVGGILVRPNRPLELLEAVKAFSETSPEWKSMNRGRVQQLATALIEESNPKVEIINFYREVLAG